MATLHFGGTDFKVFTPISAALANLPNGAGTMVVLVKTTTTGTQDLCGLLDSGGTQWYHAFCVTNISNHLGDDDGTSIVTSPTAQNDTTSWWLFAVDWPAGGSATERIHFRNQSTLGAWTHENTNANAGNRAGPGTGGWFRIGYALDFNTGQKDEALVAVWAGTRLADSDYGAWTKTSDLYSHPAGPPTLLTQLNQSTLVDLIGGSTFSSANSSGTTLTGADPDNWTLDGVGSGGGLILPRRYVTPNRQQLRAGPRALVERRLPSVSALAVSSTMAASARPSVVMAATKGVTATLAANARPAVAMTASKAVSGALAAQARPSVAITARKGVSGTLGASARPSVSMTAAKGSSGALASTARPVATITGAKGVSGTLGSSARPVVSMTGSSAPAFVGTMGVAAHPVASITAGPKGAIGAMSATGHPSVAVTARKGASGAMTATAHPAVAMSASLGARSTLTVSARPFVAMTGHHGATGTLTVVAHPRVAMTGTLLVIEHADHTPGSAGRLASAPAGRLTMPGGGILLP